MDSEVKVIVDKIKDFSKNIIKNDLPSVIKKSKEFEALKKIVPEIDEITLAYGWSGWCDGDTEFPVCIPLIDCDDLYKSQDQDNNIKWGKDNKTDKYLKKAYESMSEDDKDVFVTNYVSICDSIFDVITTVYSVGDVVRISIP